MSELKFKGAIFDLDGTLACTLPDLSYSLNEMLKTAGYPTLDEAGVLRSVNFTVREFVRLALPESVQSDENEVDRCLEIYTGIYSKHFCDHTYIYDGLAEVIAQMKSAGIRLAVNTNKEHEHAVAMIEKLCPAGTFELIIGAGIFSGKPDPTGAHHIARELGLDPSHFCYIGDSNVDMETANNAGMHAVGVSWGYRDETVLRATGADVIVHSPAEILGVIGI
ncbi:MAG: HAD-IA family hydrolase [Clostridia bacterium]|nr:HAD-IA family hydrolase [Clostridia bacterium]MBQ8511764.1 HAD-IA family hydrolase [Clostridia bacterium]